MTAAESSSASPQTTPLPDAPPPKKSVLPRILIALLILLVGFGVWKLFFSHPALPASIVALSGRIEGDDSALSAKTSGRILEVRFREGDTVKAGETIAVLDDQQVREREDQARAAVAQSEASGLPSPKPGTPGAGRVALGIPVAWQSRPPLPVRQHVRL